MTSIVSVNEKISFIDAQNIDLANQIKALQEKINFNNKLKNEIQKQPLILDLTNEKDLNIALNHDENHFYKKALEKALKYHKLSIVDDKYHKNNVIFLTGNKRILKSTSSALISIIKCDGVIKIELKNGIFYIKKTDNLKVGIYECKNENVSLVKHFFGVKQALDFLNI